jgi:hypothetical protein
VVLHALDGHIFAGLDALSLEDLREGALSFLANQAILYKDTCVRGDIDNLLCIRLFYYKKTLINFHTAFPNHHPDCRALTPSTTTH